MSDWARSLNMVQDVSQIVAISVLSVAASAGAVASVLAGFGLLPWLSLPVGFGPHIVDAGPAMQIGITALLALLCTFFPSAHRVRSIEAMRRDFSMKMDDVTQAYWRAHAADRAGTFKLSREFDAVRERLLFLRDHPDLRDLEPDVLEIAAQMSAESRELARIYSDEEVARARELLEYRRADAEELSERIARAHVATAEIRRLLEDVEVEEQTVMSRIARLREDLDELMPQLETPGPAASPSARRSMIGVVAGE